MLKSLTLENFTVFKEASFEFSEGVNVIVGENGFGKTHLLKLCYVFEMLWYWYNHLDADEYKNIDKQGFVQKIFRPDRWLNLISHGKNNITSVSQGIFNNSIDPVIMSFGRALMLDEFGNAYDESLMKPEDRELYQNMERKGFVFGNKVDISKYPKVKFTSPVFITPNEMLSIYPNFRSLYEEFNLSYDKTYHELSIKLARPTLREPKDSPLYQVLQDIQDLIKGTIILENERFYYKPNDSDRSKQEITLIAEGYRKLGQLAYLILNKSITENTVLIWDEPEANLNPKLLAPLAKIIYDMPKYGIQVFVATHSLFLLRELYILEAMEKKGGKPIDKPVKYFGLSKDEQGFAKVSTGDEFTDLDEIAALEATQQQSERYLDVF